MDRPTPNESITETAIEVAPDAGAVGSEAPAPEKPKVGRGRGYYALSDRLTGRIEEKLYAKQERELATNSHRSLSYIASRNPISRAIAASVKYAKQLPLNFYGTIGAVFGIYLILIYFIKLYSLPQFPPTFSHVILGGVTALLSLPLLFSSLPISRLICSSRILSLIFYDLFGLPELSGRSKAKHANRGIAFLLGSALGIAAFFVSPFVIVGVIFAAIYVTLSFYSPEFCFTTTIITLPFMVLFTANPIVILCSLVCLCTVSYMIKVALLKRVFRFELIDVAVLTLALIYLVSGVISAIRGNSFAPTAVFLCLTVGGYFLTANLVKGDVSLRRTVRAIIFSSAIVSAIGLIEHFLGLAINDWLDRTLFPDIAGRVTSTFGNANVLGEFLVVTVPFALCSFFISKHLPGKLFAAFAFAISLVTTILTWSRGAWIALIICGAIFALVVNRRSIFGILIAAAVSPLAIFILPDSVSGRLLSAFSSLDSSITDRIAIWRSSLESVLVHPIIGNGRGLNCVLESGECREHAHNLFLQTMLDGGIIAIAIFLSIIVMFVFASIEYRRKDRTRSFRYLYAAGFSIIIGLLIFGLVDHIWYDNRLLFLFWVTLGFCTAVRSWYREQHARTRPDTEVTPFAYGVDIPIRHEKSK